MDNENPGLTQIPHLQEVPLQSPPPHRRNRKHLIILVLLLLAVLGGGAAYWLLAKDDSPKITNFAECKAAGNPIMESYPEQCMADGQSFVNPDQSVDEQSSGQPAVPLTSQQEYLIITEWGVRIPLIPETNSDDLIYTFVKNDSYGSVFFTFQRLVEYGICKEDAGVAMTRSTTKNNPPYDIENPEQFTKIGEYYYSFAYANGGPCYNTESQDETNFYKSTGITKNTITDAAKKLEAATAN
jgi:hypothetical protein